MNRYNNEYEDTIEAGVAATDEYFEDDAFLAYSELLVSPEVEETYEITENFSDEISEDFSDESFEDEEEF
jgi:hypothetical protein